MIDANWDLAPEGADKLIQDLYEVYWGNDKGEWFDTDDMTWNKPLSKNHVTIATRPTFAESITKRPQLEQTKTVADAVEYYKGVWPESNRKIDKIKFDRIYSEFFTDFGDVHSDRFYIVCTREQFEAYAKEQEGEKWTHITPIGDPCFIKLNEPDCEGLVLIEIRNYGYELIKPEQLKPIKPTISKEQHEFLCKFSADSNNTEVIAEVESYLAKHDII